MCVVGAVAVSASDADLVPGTPPVQMSDPSTFLLIRRIIFQFVILKPVLTGIVFILQLTGAYTEGLIAWGSLYFWVSMVYNVSVSLALWGLVVLLLAVKEELVEYRCVLSSLFYCFQPDRSSVSARFPSFFASRQSSFFLGGNRFSLRCLSGSGSFEEVRSSRFITRTRLTIHCFTAKDYPPQSLATALQDLLMTFECLGLSIWHITVFPPGDYDPNSNPSAPKLSGRLPLLYAFRDAIGFRDIIDDWNHTVLLGTRFEGRRLNDEERWERALEDAGEGGRLRRSIERVRSDDPGAEGRWVLANSQRYYDSAVVRTATAPGDPESGLEEVLHASVEFPDPAAPNEQEVERLYGQARALLYGDYNYPVLGGPGAPTAEALRRKAAGYLYQVEGDDHAYLAGYHDGSNEGLPGGGSEDRGRSPGTIGAVRETSSRSRSREPAVVEPEEEEEEEDYAGRGNVPLLGSKGKGKVKLAIPRSSLEGKPDKSPILSPIDPEEVKDAMLLDMDDDGGGDEEEHGGR